MMQQEKYNLDWDTHSDYLRGALHEMMKSDDLTDVTLVCEDKKQFKAHKIVLSACSSVFKSIISEHASPLIYLRGIQHEEIQSILEFVYLGETTICQSRIEEFLKVATSLEIKEINGNMNADLVHLEDMSSSFPDLKTEGKGEEIKEDAEKGTSNQTTNQCSECDKTFSHDHNLKRHQNSVHKGIKYPCNQCDYKATQTTHLKTHIKSKHGEVN